jgi:ribonuclease J
MIIVTFCLDSKTSKLIGGPDIVTRGFVYVREAEDLMDGIKEFVKLELEKIDKANIKEWAAIKLQIRDALCSYVYKKTKRNPMILPIITEIGRAY